MDLELPSFGGKSFFPGFPKKAAPTERPRRIAEMFAGSPYRVLAKNVPYDFGHIVPGLTYHPRDFNANVAVELIKQTAPIVYADDVFQDLSDALGPDARSIAVNKNPALIKKYWNEVHKMMNAPRCIPPYDSMFIDCLVPNLFLAVQDGEEGETPALAAYVKTEPLRDLFPNNSDEIRTRVIEAFAKLYITETVQEADENYAEWIFKPENLELMNRSFERFAKMKMVGIFPYYQRNTGEIFGPWSMSIYLLDENYKAFSIDYAHELVQRRPLILSFDVGTHKASNLTHSARMSLRSNNDRACAIVMQTISLLNCSNVRLVETGETNNDKNKKQRNAERLAFVKHYELRVKVGTKELRINGRSETGEGHTPLHPVRGHFRDYSVGKGLFGKYNFNCVWVPQHVRGRVEDGIVTRDYVLEPSDQKEHASEVEQA